MPRMEVQSVRFGPDQWEVVRHAAKLTGVGTAQFIRESTFARGVAVMLLHSLHRAQGGKQNLADLKSHLTATLASHPDLCEQLLGALTDGELRLA